ncbi:MAG: hypothetical protein P8X63_14240 [Desulfuromonadaceae bacterium]
MEQSIGITAGELFAAEKRADKSPHVLIPYPANRLKTALQASTGPIDKIPSPSRAGSTACLTVKKYLPHIIKKAIFDNMVVFPNNGPNVAQKRPSRKEKAACITFRPYHFQPDTVQNSS